MTQNHDFDDLTYIHDKPVHVRCYSRVRFGELENVRQHYRSYPNT